ncbi:MAG: cytochrome P450 [Acidimicrobiia bacterium]
MTSEHKAPGAGIPVFNPFEPGFAADPYGQYAALVAENPVQQLVFGPWAAFRYDDCVSLLRDPRISVADDAVRGANVRVEARRQILGEERAARGTRQMLNLDPPDHTRLRGLVQQVFTPKMIEGLTARVQQLVDGLLAAAVATTLDGELVDLIRDFAFPLPFMVIAEMLGMPDGADREVMRDLAHTLTLGLEPVLAFQHMDEIMVASDAMNEHVLDAIAWKRAHLGDDLLSGLIAAEQDGDRLSPDELLDQVILLYIAGHETTVNLIGNGTLALLRHRAQWERWAADPSLAGNAVEELLRYDPPVQFSRRITTSPVELAGQTIDEGMFVLTGLAAANRDPAKWGDTAAELDLGRVGAAQHLSFGSGIHHCLGAALRTPRGAWRSARSWPRFPGTTLATDEPAERPAGAAGPRCPPGRPGDLTVRLRSRLRRPGPGGIVANAQGCRAGLRRSPDARSDRRQPARAPPDHRARRGRPPAPRGCGRARAPRDRGRRLRGVAPVPRRRRRGRRRPLLPPRPARPSGAAVRGRRRRSTRTGVAETVTYVLDGEIAHHDSHGGGGVTGEGDTQWMTAARASSTTRCPPSAARRADARTACSCG